MLDIVDFLEHVGRDARLRDASQADMESAASDAGLNPELRQAVVAGDKARLEVLLGSRNVCSVMIPGKEDDSEEERKDDEDDRQQGPSPDDDLASSLGKFREAS